MKTRHALTLFALFASATVASAQTQIWRCGNTYTNDKSEAQAKGCRTIEGAPVTVMPAVKVPRPAPTPVARSAEMRVDPQEQRGSGLHGLLRAHGVQAVNFQYDPISSDCQLRC